MIAHTSIDEIHPPLLVKGVVADIWPFASHRRRVSFGIPKKEVGHLF